MHYKVYDFDHQFVQISFGVFSTMPEQVLAQFQFT